MLKRLGPLRFVLGSAALTVLLAGTAGLWWWLPAGPVVRWQIPFPFYGLWLSESGRSLVAIKDEEGETKLTVWDVPSGRLRAEFPYVHPAPYFLYRSGPMPDLWMSPDDSVLVYQGRVCNLASGREPFSLPPTALTWLLLPDSEVVLPAEEKTLSLITGQTRPLPAELAEFLRPDPRFAGLGLGWRIIGLGGPRLLLWYHNGLSALAVWDMKENAFCFKSYPCKLDRPSLEPTGRLLVGTNGRATEIWDVTTGAKLLSVSEPERWVGPWQFSPDGSRLVLQVYDQPIDDWSIYHPRAMQLWDVATRPPRKIGSDKSACPKFSPDGKQLFFHSSGIIRDTTAFEEQPVRVRFSANPFPRRLAPSRFLTGPRDLTPGYPIISSDSRFLIGPRDRTPTPPSWLLSWFSRQEPAGRYLEAVDMATGTVCLSIYRGQGRELLMRQECDLRHTPSGEQLFVYDEDGSITVWNIPPHRPWWVEYGLPVVFFGLLLGTVWHCVRSTRAVKGVVPGGAV